MSQANPGSRISARSRRVVGDSSFSIRQKSKASPTRSLARRPRRRPGPPMSWSMRPRTAHKNCPLYQPLSPPIVLSSEKMTVGESAENLSRRSENTAPPAQAGSSSLSRKWIKSASENLVGAPSPSVIRRARSIDSRSVSGTTWNSEQEERCFTMTSLTSD